MTICTRDREEFFGEVRNGRMNLNDEGNIARNNLQNVQNYFKNVLMDEFIIMPNHIHCIIEINNVEVQFIEPGGATRFDKSNLYKSTDQIKNNPMLLEKTTLGKIIRHYKAKTTSEIRNYGKFWKFAWQRNYYDHIVRSYESLNRIREYIISNPMVWERDRNNIENIWM